MANRFIIITGNGKGKTTSAVGTLLRAIGHEQPCAIIQFVKSEMNSGEINILQKFPTICQVHITGKGFVPPYTSPLFHEHQLAAKQGWELAKTLLNDSHTEVIVLDELLTALNLNLLSLSDVYANLANLSENKKIIITGRNAPKELIDLADTVSEVQAIKHGYEIGIPAQQGIEY